jgi:hypothetical protein
MKVFSVTPMPASFAKKARGKTDMNDMHPARLLKRVCKAQLPLPLAPVENNNATVQGEMVCTAGRGRIRFKCSLMFDSFTTIN